MTREKAAIFPPVYKYFSSIEVGDNVNWYQDNYKHFLSTMDSTNPSKIMTFGKRAKIEATNSTNESIDLNGAAQLKFGVGASIKITGRGDILNVKGGSLVEFDNPIGIELDYWITK